MAGQPRQRIPPIPNTPRPMTSLIARPYSPTDLPALLRLDGLPAEDAYQLAELPGDGGQAVVLSQGKRLLGYAAAQPLPGLDRHLELALFIAPAGRRRGHGQFLLQALLAQLRQTDARLVSCSVPALNSPAGLFLQRQQFFLEHEEWQMVRDLADLPAVQVPAGYSLTSYPRHQAIAHFRRLYELAFAAEPAYQPYESDHEVDRDLGHSDDLLFLTPHAAAPIGFVWTRFVTRALGELEPLGIAAAYQGKGLGRVLLPAGLRHLAERGHQQARLGVWADNARAIRLYRQFGFHHTSSRYFLAYQLRAE